MKYMIAAFFTSLLQKFCHIKTWLPMLLIPLAVWSCLTFLPREERTAPVQVGVAYPEEGADEFRAGLEARSGTVVTFLAADEDTIRGKVATGQWDCGLLLDEDFDQRLNSLDMTRLITVCIGESSTVYPLVRETVAACIAELAAPDMAYEYLASSGMLTPETEDAANALLEQILTDEDRILIQLETAYGEPLDAPELADDSLHGILRGLIAVVLLIWLMFSAMDLGRWLDTPAAKRLRPLRPVTALLLPRALAAALPAFLSSCAALCLLPDGFRSLLPLAAYLCALCALSLLAARAPKVFTAFPYLLSFVPVICLLLSPIIVDLSLFFPAIAPVQACILVTMFLRGCDGSVVHTLLLAAITVLAVLLSVLADTVSRLRVRTAKRHHTAHKKQA